jgi:signal transduction histidine kinase
MQRRRSSRRCERWPANPLRARPQASANAPRRRQAEKVARTFCQLGGSAISVARAAHKASSHRDPRDHRQVLAISALIVAILVVRAAIHPLVADKHQYVPAYAAIAAATFLLGTRAGVIVAIAGLVIGEMFPAVQPWDRAAIHVLSAFAGYVATASAIVWSATWLRNDRFKSRERERRLREADRRKDEFISLLGHELRNPLATLAMGESVLKSEGLSARAAADALQLLERQTQYMDRIVSELLDSCRIQSGKLTLQRVTLDVANAVADAVIDVTPITRAKRQTVHLAEDGAPGEIDADPVRVHQMLSNLLQNAAKFSPVNSQIVVKMIGRTHSVSISVADPGIGIEASELQRIFEPYVQIDSASSRGSGLGLGLSLTSQLAHMHGGTVRAFSAGLGRGSEFLLTMPRNTPTEPNSPTQPDSLLRLS